MPYFVRSDMRNDNLHHPFCWSDISTSPPWLLSESHPEIWGVGGMLRRHKQILLHTSMSDIVTASEEVTAESLGSQKKAAFPASRPSRVHMSLPRLITMAPRRQTKGKIRAHPDSKHTNTPSILECTSKQEEREVAEKE